jgi:CRISPR/Cas system-associated exonuclease Cas4 (RecB family)
VPPELRKAFGMPTYEYQDSVWAYYFYRMVSRAEKVWLVYDSRTDSLKRGEESRYIKQLMYHYGIPLRRHVADAELTALDVEDESVEKTDEIMDVLDTMTFSVSALQNYVICPMKFYYQSVLKIRKDEEVAESLDSAMIGNVYHNAMRALYYGDDAMMSDAPFEKMDRQPDKGMDEVTTDYLEKWLSEESLELISAKVESLMKAELNVDEIHGRDLVVRTVIVRYVIETLKKDLEFLQKTRVDAFGIIGLEKKVVAEVFGCRFFGVVDRIDTVVPGTVRLVDYKSGSDSQTVLDVTDDTAEKVVARIFDEPYSYKKAYKAALQFYIYGKMIKEIGIAEEGHMYNSLYSTSEIFKGYPQMYPESTKFCRMMDERLEGILAELKNSKVPFVRTGEPDACRYCDFKMICGR